MNTSPLEDKAAIVSSQLVIFEICESLTDCGGRYGWIPLGKACMGKLYKSKFLNISLSQRWDELYSVACVVPDTLYVSRYK